MTEPQTPLRWIQAWTERVPDTDVTRLTAAGLEAPAVCIAYALATHCRTARAVEASRRQIARWTGYSIRTVVTHLDALVAAGVLLEVRQRDEDTGAEGTPLWVQVMPVENRDGGVQELHGGVQELHGGGARAARAPVQELHPSSSNKPVRTRGVASVRAPLPAEPVENRPRIRGNPWGRR